MVHRLCKTLNWFRKVFGSYFSFIYISLSSSKTRQKTTLIRLNVLSPWNHHIFSPFFVFHNKNCCFEKHLWALGEKKIGLQRSMSTKISASRNYCSPVQAQFQKSGSYDGAHASSSAKPPAVPIMGHISHEDQKSVGQMKSQPCFFPHLTTNS